MDCADTVTVPAPEQTRVPAARRAGVRLKYIDGLRALAALYVAAGHAFKELDPYRDNFAIAHPHAAPAVEFFALLLFGHGHFAVAVFIVISGFCLMLPLALKERTAMESTGHFIARRARRILPPITPPSALLCY